MALPEHAVLSGFTEEAALDPRLRQRRQRHDVEGARRAAAVQMNRLRPLRFSRAGLPGDDERHVGVSQGRERVFESAYGRARAYEGGGPGAYAVARAVEVDHLIGGRHTATAEQGARQLCQSDTDYAKRGYPVGALCTLEDTSGYEASSRKDDAADAW